MYKEGTVVENTDAPRKPSNSEAPSQQPHTGRRRLFWVWVVLTAVIALYVGIAGPFASYFHEDMWLIAIVGPPLMIILLSTGLAWLAWWVFGTRRHDRRP
jgi:uncharacterized membrane protein YhaH (DUF805 family)